MSFKEKLKNLVKELHYLDYGVAVSFAAGEGYRLSNLERRMRELCNEFPITAITKKSKRGTNFISGWEWGEKKLSNELEQVATANTPESRKIMEDVMRTTINGVSVPVFAEKKEKKVKETNAPKNTLF